MKKSPSITRRKFIHRGAGTLLSLVAAPAILPASVLGRDANTPPSDKVTMAFLGLGTMGSGHIFGEAWTYLPGGYLARSDVQILAVSDVWKDKQEKVKDRINLFYSRKYGKDQFSPCQAYSDFRQILERKDIDAVLIATPIHWHATMAILAAQAGKDIYCEKPTAVCVKESQAMLKAVMENKRVYQAGTQQRSEYGGKFRQAVELIRNRRIGELKTVYCVREGGGAMWPETTGDAQPIPDGFDWDLWLGPAPKIPFQGHYDAHLFGYGGINWGQHHYDIVQWALDADKSGPVKLDVDQNCAVYHYANGVTVYGRAYPENPIGETGGGWYIGPDGKIGVDREHLVSEPAGILEKPIGPNDIQVYHSDSHSGNFLDCVKTRKPTICNAEVAHHAASVMLLGGIVQRLNRPLTWDPQKEVFINDDEANRLLDLPKREPWVV